MSSVEDKLFGNNQRNIVKMATEEKFNLSNSCPDRKSTIPAVGFGCWKLPKETASDLVFKAIQIGYRHIDSACDYGNEKEVDIKI